MATSISSTNGSLASTGSISSAGLGSGLDVNSIVTQLMAVENRPLTLLQQTATDLNTKLSNVGKMQSLFATLRDKAAALSSSTLWAGTTSRSSDAASVKVSTGANAASGAYAVTVNKLAVGQTVISAALPAATSTLGQGTLTIELGSYGAGSPAADFTAKAGSSPVTIDIGSGDTSLAAIRDKINSAQAGVTAAIVTDASGARLSLRSAATGAENAFRISATEASDDGSAATGLSALAYDGTAASSTLSRSMAAGNAEATVNGISVSSASNTLDNVVDGLTLTLQKVTSTEVNVTVAADTDGVKTAVTDFVSAFNGLASFIKTQTAYNPDSKVAGALQGDQATLALQSQLRNVLNVASTASGTWSKLSEIGLTVATDGTLATDSTKLGNALGNLGELKKLLATDGATNADSGFARRFKNLADVALGSDGSFNSRTSGLRTSLDRNSKSQDAMQQRLTQTESRLRKQYQSLDTKMSQLTSLSNYMTQQITKLNASNG
ncbi:MAG: flagellar hook protein [Burkholderiales bacterium PBB5]|nr:MAG: flagellar hook protein [Burkholderiales bacterium PBB5]